MILELWRSFGHRLTEWLAVVMCLAVFWPQAVEGEEEEKENSKEKKLLRLFAKQYLSSGMVSVRIEELAPGVDKENEEDWRQAFLVEREIVESQETMRIAIQKLDLVKRWRVADEGKAVARLKGQVQTEHLPKTPLLRVKVRSTDPEEAAELARAVMEAYAERRNRFERVQAEKALQALRGDLADQEDRLRRLRKRHQEAAEGAGEDPEPLNNQDVVESLRELAAAAEIVARMKLACKEKQAKLRVPRRVVDLHSVPRVPTRPVR